MPCAAHITEGDENSRDGWINYTAVSEMYPLLMYSVRWTQAYAHCRAVRMTLRHREAIFYMLFGLISMYTKSVVSCRDLINNIKHVCSNFLRYSRAARLLDGHKQKEHLSSLYMHSFVLNFRSGLACKMGVKCKFYFTNCY